jgi:hypothetical protein
MREISRPEMRLSDFAELMTGKSIVPFLYSLRRSTDGRRDFAVSSRERERERERERDREQERATLYSVSKLWRPEDEIVFLCARATKRKEIKESEDED